MFARSMGFACALLAGCATAPPRPLDTATSPPAWADACAGTNQPAEWEQPAPPFRLSGDTYYVGTCGITALLITSPDGHVVVDSGTDEGAKIVLANIRTLGFDPRGVRRILMSHEHFDHVGGMARLQAATGATVMATEAAAAVLRTGVTSADDPQADSDHPPFPPVTGPVETVGPGTKVRIGSRVFSVIPTPGHTRGATSWTWQDCAGGVCRTFVHADSMNPISSEGFRFSDHPALVAGFRRGIAAIDAAPCDIVLAPHPGAVNLRARLSGERPLIDPQGCRRYAAVVTQRLDKRLAEEGGPVAR